ncbi:MAG: YggS family pyridoxal phosphate-dependent enzyme [Candidatus Planktophila sp.]|nr:YggS family pyridoxal phosphate-dependent enzyme [Candidatus Planktophila sp.]
MTRRAEIAQHLLDVEQRIAAAAKKAERDPAEITLIAVTKTFPISDIEILIELGVHDFGENRDGDAAPKAAAVGGRWHFQGQIQSNKLKSICSWAHVIHSLDELRHFDIIEKFATHPLDIFLQVNLDGLANRGGAAIESLYPLASIIEAHPVHKLAGLMAVAPLGIDPEIAFGNLHQIQRGFLGDFPAAKSLSAGMSHDFEIAISHGATHLRIGSQIMGSR